MRTKGTTAENKSAFTCFAGNYNNAFTLLELLVVIGIIVLLIAILLPVLGRGRAIGQRIVCKSNLKEIGLGVVMYFDEYGRYPYLMEYWTADGPKPEWNIKTALKPYLETEEIFCCPSDKQSRNTVGWYQAFGNSYVWSITYSALSPGKKIGYRDVYDSAGILERYKEPMLFDNVPNHFYKNVKQWPRKNRAMRGGFGTHFWLLKNPNTVKGFDSVWPDTHVENGLGADYVRYLNKYKKSQDN